jgi:hypothetical protein
LIQNIIPEYRLENFSFPFGEQSLISRNIIKHRYRSARSIYKGINSGKVDLNGLKSIRLYEHISLDEIFQLINKAMEINGWIVFYTHDVENSHSDIGCTPEYFEKVVKYCYERKLKVLTVNDALNFIEK